jgi:hypothetical protein
MEFNALLVTLALFPLEATQPLAFQIKIPQFAVTTSDALTPKSAETLPMDPSAFAPMDSVDPTVLTESAG